MNLDIVQVCAALKTQLETTGARVYDYIPDGPGLPCVVIFLQPFDYDTTYDDGVDLKLVLQCLGGSVNTQGAQQTLYGWLSTGTDMSIHDAIAGNATLDGYVSDTRVTRLDSYGIIELPNGGTRIWAADLHVDILA